MNRRFQRPGFAWLLLALWTVWLFALQGVGGRIAFLGAWVPDFGLLVVLGLATRVPLGRLYASAFIVALARAAVSIDPFVAVFGCYFGAALLASSLRGLVDVDRASLRVPIAALAALGTGAWLALVRAVQEGPLPSAAETVPVAVMAGAVGTSLASLILGPVLLHLPGLRPLWSRARG